MEEDPEIFKPIRCRTGKTPEQMGRSGRLQGMRHDGCWWDTTKSTLGLIEREIYIPHRRPINKSDACCDKLNVT